VGFMAAPDEIVYALIVIWGRDAERHVHIVEPLEPADTPRDVKGSSAG